MSRVGDKIREERMKKGISPKQLARKCGLSESYILDIESGKKIINEKLLNQFSKIFDKNIEESMEIQPKKEEIKEERVIEKNNNPIKRRETVKPLGQWEDALSNIIKKVPIFDIEMKKIKEYRSFPIIDRKVEGVHPDKILYVEAPDDSLKGFRICKGDYILIYLNHECINNSLSLVEYDGKKRLKKIKRIEGNKLQLMSYDHEKKELIKNMKEVKIIGRGMRIEININK